MKSSLAVHAGEMNINQEHFWSRLASSFSAMFEKKKKRIVESDNPVDPYNEIT